MFMYDSETYAAARFITSTYTEFHAPKAVYTILTLPTFPPFELALDTAYGALQYGSNHIQLYMFTVFYP